MCVERGSVGAVLAQPVMCVGECGNDVLVFSLFLQVETIGEYGVVFIVFCVALEFSPDKLRKV